ncbi:hypothetical protein ATANTOWER_027866 [Ataeniobius toweri]|uniref:Uncharacterized protein n=1 Tax=Ataeniobius toweri TaxID=208326 RepID=A0ABU7BL22_9TELE|nr:hypothetical protein [Ataeniobius toweri]
MFNRETAWGKKLFLFPHIPTQLVFIFYYIFPNVFMSAVRLSICSTLPPKQIPPTYETLLGYKLFLIIKQKQLLTKFLWCPLVYLHKIQPLPEAHLCFKGFMQTLEDHLRNRNLCIRIL